MYLRMRLKRWSDIEASVGQLTLRVKPGRALGFMEVYEKIEDMEADYPGETEYIEIEEVKK